MFILYVVKYSGIACDGVAERKILVSPEKHILFSLILPFKQNGKTKMTVFTVILPHAALYRYAQLSALWCLYLYKSEKGKKIHSLSPFSPQPPPPSLMKVSPRASLCGPSCCLVINSCSEPLWHDCKYWPYLPNQFFLWNVTGGGRVLRLTSASSAWRYHLSLIKSKWKSHNVVGAGGGGARKRGHRSLFFSGSTNLPQ